MNKKVSVVFMFVALAFGSLRAADHKGITSNTLGSERFTLVENGNPVAVLIDEADNVGVQIAAKSLQNDFKLVTGTAAPLVNTPDRSKMVIVGTLQSKYIKEIVKNKKLDKALLEGKVEKYIMTTIANPIAGVEEALVIAGSDRRGAIYGIYELSEQIGVSPWYDWADVPVVKQQNLSIANGTYTAGEPAVRYRGIFLNDEAPCLTSWVENTYGTKYGDHRFYARVFELILRLRGNYLWPAMWGWSFYADDPLNSKTADDMGIIMGTSHHEPMARNHQEWARKRAEYGAWDYATNQTVIDKFFREGIERAAKTEDLITVGMRGDGDTPMGGKEGEDDKYVPDYDYMISLMKKIIDNQRKIIKDVTGKPASKRPQVWALYKEVQELYDRGMRMPDDVIILLSDDNWGDIRRLPNAEERKHPGGWGMYYHVDYVGAPRNSKWLNVTHIQHLWEQMQLTYDYGVDKIWVLNVGDLKPMEYPITLFLDMAWNPKKFTADNLLEHTREFCAEAFGESQADEAARLLNLVCKYNGRITAEMLDATVYNLETGEFEQVLNQYVRLEAEALRQYLTLAPEARDAYQQLILFPAQAMGNIYELYYSQAMNLKLAAANDPEANYWADRCEKAFARDAELCAAYNNTMSGGKWKGMMTQKHISYTIWNDSYPADVVPHLERVEAADKSGGYIFSEKAGVVSMEAEHYYSQHDGNNGKWTVIPHLGRTLSGVSLMPYSTLPDGASMTYKFNVTSHVDTFDILIAVNSTLPFYRTEGHRYAVSLDGGEEIIVNFNERMNENPENIYTIYYPTVATRVIKSTLQIPVKASAGEHTLTVRPIEPGTVFEKIVVDCGGYMESYLFMDESPKVREK